MTCKYVIHVFKILNIKCRSMDLRIPILGVDHIGLSDTRFLVFFLTMVVRSNHAFVPFVYILFVSNFIFIFLH